MNWDEFKDSLDLFCNGDLPEEQFQSFESAMLQDAEKRAYYLRYMNLDAAIKDGLSVDEQLESLSNESSNSSLFLRAAILILSIGSFLYVLFSIAKMQNEATLNIQVSDELTNDGVAIITKAIGFNRAQAGITRGATIKPGLLELSSGLLQVELYSGVTLIVEGPASIDIIDSMNVACNFGQLRAKVPNQALGFRVHTEEYNVVDLGTEFSISVDRASGRSDFLVHQGEIEVFKEEKLLNSLKTGEGIGYSKGQTIEHSINTKSFKNIDSLYRAQGSQRFAEWQVYAEAMKNRDDVSLFYDFESSQSWSRTLENKSRFTSESLNAAIVGCQWSSGRWKSKGALDYKSISDRVRLNLEGEYESVSFTTWVKIDSFDRWLSSLFLTDDFNRNELHWQLSDVGEIILGVSVRGIGNTFSPAVITPEHLGQWLYIVTVLDQENNLVVHYLNGQKVHERSFEPNFKVSFGNSEIGNWKSKASRDRIRSLNGKMDEFVLFNRALSSEEVFKFYQMGKPE